MSEQYIIGIDLGGTSAKLGLFSQEGRLLDKWEIPTNTANRGERILPDLTESLHRKLQERRLTPDAVRGVGLDVPGAVLENRFVAPCVNLNQWGGFDAAECFSALCCLPVKVLNDANAAALGEMWQGGAKGAQNVVFVTLGTGVGGGIVIGGKVTAGVHGAGGEIGHIKVREGESRACGCGKHGCLEQYASASGLDYTIRKALASSAEPSELRRCAKPTAKDVFDCAKAGDRLALLLANDFSDMLGRALANVSCVCDPDVFVIGGGISAAGTFLLDAVQKAFIHYAFPAAEHTAFRFALLGNDAGIYGSAKLIME